MQLMCLERPHPQHVEKSSEIASGFVGFHGCYPLVMTNILPWLDWGDPSISQQKSYRKGWISMDMPSGYD
jgi:hypothetical protein